jgi:hypothetical protein
MAENKIEKVAPLVAPSNIKLATEALLVAESKVKKAVIMGYEDEDQDLIALFSDIFSRLPKDNISVGVAFPSEKKLLDIFQSHTKEFQELKQNKQLNALLERYHVTWEILEKEAKNNDYVARISKLDTPGTKFTVEVRSLIDLVSKVRSLNVNLALCESILKNSHTVFGFAGDDATMARNIIAALTSKVFVVMKAADVEGVGALLADKGIVVEKTGARLLVDRLIGDYESVYNASLFLLEPTNAAIPAGTAAVLAESGMGGVIGSLGSTKKTADDTITTIITASGC